jgi:hypothetical protein
MVQRRWKLDLSKTINNHVIARRSIISFKSDEAIFLGSEIASVVPLTWDSLAMT